MVQNQKQKNKINNQIQSHFDSIIDLNQKIVTTLYYSTDHNKCQYTGSVFLIFSFLSYKDDRLSKTRQSEGQSQQNPIQVY